MVDLSVNKGSTIYRFIWVSAWYAFAAVVVLVAVMFAAARLLLPYADQYNAELGERLSSYLNQPVSVRSLDAEWHGLGPSLVLRDAMLLDAMGERPVFHLKKIRLGFDLFGSVRHWEPVFANITLVGIDLELTRNQQGEIFAAGITSQKKDVSQAPEDAASVAGWLFSQGRLSLENSNITWHDEMGAGRVMHFTAVNVSLRNDGDRHQLDASVALSRKLGKSLKLRVDMQGDPLQVKGRRTQLYLAGEFVHLTELFEPQSLAGVNVSVKSASFQLWSQWRDGQLQRINGSANADGVALVPVATNPDKKPLLLNRAAADFEWQAVDAGWRFDANDLQLASQSRQWQPARVSLKFATPTETSAKFDAYASFLQLEDISQMLTLFSVGGEVVQQPLFALNPRGEIREAAVSWQSGKAPQYHSYARLRNASVNAWRAIPAAQAVDGQLWLDSARGQVELQHAAVTLGFPRLFRWPLAVDELRGTVAWQREGEHWQVTGRKLEARNEDVSATATLDVIQDDANKSPFMSLLVNFHDGDGSQVARYLPTGIMAEQAVDWLDEAIVDAHVISGGAIFHGRLGDFPFDRGDGRFEVSFSADNGRLNYAKGWPAITGITANVSFTGRGMLVEMQKGKIFSNDIRWAKVSTDDMTTMPILLSIKGEVDGATQEKLDYLISSPPLYAAFAQHLDGISASGNSALNLDLLLPLGAGNDDVLKVNGWLTMTENTLSISLLGQVLGKVGGRLNFSQNGLQAKNIQAKLFGQATRINIASDQSGLDPQMRLRARGIFNAQELAGRYLPSIKELLAGDGGWDVSFDIPLSSKVAKAGGVPSVAVLRAQTNLKGVEARLPPPFDKAAEEPGSLELRVDFPPKKLPVLRVNYESFVDGIFALGDMTLDDTLSDSEKVENSFRGEVRLNSGTAQLPSTPGLRLMGWMDKVSLDDWRNLQLATAVSGEVGVPLFSAADVAARELEAYGQKLHNVRFKLATRGEDLQADIESKELKGSILVPHNLQNAALRADLKYWHLEEIEEGGDVLDPRVIPALDFRIADFRYKKARFGSVRLEAANVADGLRIEQLVVKPRSTTMTARGGWYVRGEDQTSNIQMHVESENVGHTLRALDYVGGIDKGKGTVDLEMQWPGSFADVSAYDVQGKLNMSLQDGYLLDVDPGAGRMFGMLSIQTLPRRLLLDFSDVFKKGFGFDRLKGSFSIEDGDAYTNDLYMDGPAARVDITGRTGLAEQNYDQLVTVTPHVSESLPMLGVLTATPQVGAIVLAIQKLFKPAIDEATKNQYTITGSWDHPVIKKVKRIQPGVKPVEDGEP